MRALRDIYKTDGEKGKFTITDFIKQLQIYDTRGIAAARELRKSFYDPDSTDAFIRAFSAGFTE